MHLPYDISEFSFQMFLTALLGGMPDGEEKTYIEKWAGRASRVRKYDKGRLAFQRFELDFLSGHSPDGLKIQGKPGDYKMIASLTELEARQRSMGNFLEVACSNELRAFHGLPPIDWYGQLVSDLL